MNTKLRCFLTSAVVSALAVACTTSPTGRKQLIMVSDSDVNQMGLAAFAQMKQKDKLSTDPRKKGTIDCVVNTLVAQLPEDWKKLPWEAQAFAIDSPNAFALPGGKVGVYTGIFDVARNQDQFAAVIGHEIGHVIERHHDERVTRQMGAAGAVQLLSVLAGARYGQSGSQLASQGGSVIAQTGFLLPGTREQETEADVVGQRLMAQAGFDPRQAVDLWQNMLAASASRPPEWLSTHPDPKSRIGELRKRAESLMPVYQQARAAGRKPACG